MIQKSLFDDLETTLTPKDAITNIANSGCQECPRGVWRNTQSGLKITVAKGNPNAKIIVVGKSPGIADSEVGLPFSFGSMDMLTKMLKSVGIDPIKDCLLTNPVFCPMHDDKDPSMGDIKTCMLWFKQLIDSVRPKIFIALGATAYKGLSHKPIIMNDIAAHINPMETIYNIPAFVVYHPAYFFKQGVDVNKLKREAYNTLRAASSYLEAING